MGEGIHKRAINVLADFISPGAAAEGISDRVTRALLEFGGGGEIESGASQVVTLRVNAEAVARLGGAGASAQLLSESAVKAIAASVRYGVEASRLKALADTASGSCPDAWCSWPLRGHRVRIR
jgi:hypothetical protein